MTASSLEGCLKTVWTKELIGAQLDMSNAMNRQVYTIGDYRVMPGSLQAEIAPLNVDMSSQAVRMRKQRLEEANKRLAYLKRKGKPSYRQRQKNARAAKG